MPRETHGTSGTGEMGGSIVSCASRSSGFKVPKTSNSRPSRSFRRPLTQNPELRTQNFCAHLASPARLAVIEKGKKKPKPIHRVSAFPDG